MVQTYLPTVPQGQADRRDSDNPHDSVIEPSQYAYRASVSTNDALLQYVDDYTKFLDDVKTKFVQSACLDFCKAFDLLLLLTKCDH